LRGGGFEVDIAKVSERVALLTGGGDKPYALGMAMALSSVGNYLDFIGSDDLEVPDLLNNPQIRFLNLRGDQRPESSVGQKLWRVTIYYMRLLNYATTAEPRIFHLLWNNKFQFFDRTLLMLYYKVLGKKVTFTVHNVNAGERDANDSWLNRVSLRAQYQLVDHLFVHTDKMKRELVSGFAVPPHKVSVIPFGINNTVPNTNLSTAQAKEKVDVKETDRTMLFFGNIAPYKGLDDLVAAFIQLAKAETGYRLLIVGRPKHDQDYWRRIDEVIMRSEVRDRIRKRIEYVPDEDTELYFKAADVLILPYTHVFQSGVLFLGYSFGLPAIATDVGSLREEIVEGETGFLAKPRDPSDLARAIRRYFESDLYRNLADRRAKIRTYANDRYSWNKVARITTNVYSNLLAARYQSKTSRETDEQRKSTRIY
jgi:glycosyltransferase involved in cell wall biosynthesis